MIHIPSDHWHIAIDPGASGGIAWKNGDGPMMAVAMLQEPTDTVKLLSDLVVKGYTVLHIEQLPRFVPMGGGKGIPGSMAAVMFENFGIVLGAAMALGYRIERVTPQAWQKELGLGTSKGLSKTEWKNKLKGRAQELFPNIPITLKTADALLIWEFGRRKIDKSY